MKSPLIPHITEKSYRGIAEDGKGASTYTFKVVGSLSKQLIKKFVEREHKVTVTDVNIINLPGKSRRFKGVQGRVSTRHKALVRLKAGEKIAAFEIKDTKSEEKE